MTATAAQLGIRALRKLGIVVAITASTDTVPTLALADIATAALRKLAVISAEETAPTLDQAEALARATSVHGILVALGLATWEPGAVPIPVTEYYIIMTAQLLAPQFGKAATEEAFTAAQAAVRQIALAGAYGQALATQKVSSVHYSLEARGRVRWTLYDIPVWAEEDYVMLAAVLLAPECGQKADPTWSDLAERDLMRIVSLPSEREPVAATYF
jgi:hypothetical protein